MRGDSVDNIPGAPGIGDKGSVDLIQRFGSVEAALDRAAEVERKTYRESLQNNRDMVLLSKQLVTIDCNVAVDFEPDAMLSQAPDAEAARALFTELEFNTLTKEFISESVELGETDYREAASASDVEAVLAEARAVPGSVLAVALESARSGSTQTRTASDTTTGSSSTSRSRTPRRRSCTNGSRASRSFHHARKRRASQSIKSSRS